MNYVRPCYAVCKLLCVIESDCTLRETEETRRKEEEASSVCTRQSLVADLGFDSVKTRIVTAAMASAQQTLSFSSIVPPVTPLLLPQARSPRFRADNSVSSHASISGNRSRICQRSSCKPHCPFSSFLRREGEESRGGTRRISTSSSPGGKLRMTISRPLCVQASLKPQLEEAAKQVVCVIHMLCGVLLRRE